MLLEHSGYCRMLWIHYVQGSVTTMIPVSAMIFVWSKCLTVGLEVPQ